MLNDKPVAHVEALYIKILEEYLVKGEEERDRH